MKLELKEDPVEWKKFAWVLCALAALLSGLAFWNGKIGSTPFLVILATGIGGATVSLVRPRWFRGIYRGGMRVSFFVGQRIGMILLLLVFFIVATPTGLLLRLFRKDLLDIRSQPDSRNSYWRPSAPPSDLEKHF